MVRVAVVVQELEQVLPRQVAAPFDDAGQAAVGQVDVMLHAVLATEVEGDVGAFHLNMLVPQRRQAEALVGLGIFLVADAHHRPLQQGDDGGQHLPLGQARQCQVVLHLCTDRGQYPAEGEHLAILRLVAYLPPPGMVAILLPAPGIAAHGLQVAAGITADPNVGVGGRDRQLADAVQHLRVGDRGA